MNEHDHFSNVLDVESVEESHELHFDDGHSGMAADVDEAQAHGVQAPRKKPIPKALLLVGGMVAFIVVGVGYQHFFSAHSQSSVPMGTQENGSGDPPETPLPTGTAITQQTRGGMLGPNVPPLPSSMNAPASASAGVTPQQQGGRAPTGDAASAISADVNPSALAASFGDAASQAASAATVPPGARSPALIAGSAGSTPATSAPAPDRSAVGLAAMPATGSDSSTGGDAPVAATGTPAVDPKDAEIAKLQAELDTLRRTARGSGSVHAAAHRVGKHSSHAMPIAKASARAADSDSTVGVAQGASDADEQTASNAQANAGVAQHASEADSVAASSSPMKPGKHGGGRHRDARHVQHHMRKSAPLLAGYAIKQVIPGQGWVEDEQTGKQQVVAVGDSIGNAKVVRIDPDNYRIVTTAGVIQ